MEGLIEALHRHQCIALDSTVLLYYFEAHPEYGPLSRAVMREVANGLTAITSVLTLMDSLVMPLRLKKPELYRDHLDGLQSFPNLQVVSLDEATAERAAALRALHPNLPTPTALTMAAGLLKGATIYVSNNTRHIQIPELKVLNLRDVDP